MPGNIPSPTWLFRITHIGNLPHILQHGVCCRSHPNADPNFIDIGSTEIIGVRKSHPVKINGYGNIGDYVPFYFDARSIMLYNILTGYGVPKRKPEDIIVLATTVASASKCDKYFFTDGQANTYISGHYNDLKNLDKIDWDVVTSGNFKKAETDTDRSRRYQAEFLIHHHVPLNCIEAIAVYNQACANFVKSLLDKAGLLIPVHIKKSFYFNR